MTKNEKHIKFPFNLPVFCWPTLFFTILIWLPYLQIVSHDLSFGDEGVVLQSASRIAKGEIPFKDFFTAMVPGSYYFYAILFKIFGASFLVARVGVIAVSSALIISIWFALHRLSIRSYPSYLLTASFLAYFGGPVWFVASHHWLSALLCMASLVFLLPTEGKEAPSWNNAFIAGILSTLAAFTLQHRGGIWIIASVLALFFIPKKYKIKTFSSYIAGIMATSTPLAIYYISMVGWNTLYYDLITFPITRYKMLEGHAGFDIHPVEMIMRYMDAWNYISKPSGLLYVTVMTFGLFGMLFVYLAPLLSIVAIFYLYKTSNLKRYTITMLTAALIASYFATIHRISDTTMFFASAPAILCIATALNLRTKYKPSVITLEKKSFITYIFILVFSCTALGYSYLMLQRQKITFETPAGNIKTIFRDERDSFILVQKYAKDHFTATDKVFCYPYTSIFYFLFRLENPSRFDIITYPMHTEEQLQEAGQSLENSNCRWIIVDTYQKKQLSQQIPLENYIMKKYVIRDSSPYATILERRP